MSTSIGSLSRLNSGATLDQSQSTINTSLTTTKRLADLPITPNLTLLRRKDIELGQVLGRGRYSEVNAIERIRDCNHNNSSSNTSTKNSLDGSPNGRYVMKHLQNKLFANKSHRRSARELTNAIADLVTEAMYLAKLRHPHIVQLRGLTKGGTAALKRTKATGEDYFLILDRMEETLDQRIGIRWRKQYPKSIPPSLLLLKLRYAYQMANALSYLHSHSILYRDLKPENIGFVLQDSSLPVGDPDRDRLQLFDFGLARELDAPPPPDDSHEEERLYSLSASGTRRYMAPEIFWGKGKYNYKADVYSWAIVLYECLAHTKPFADFTTQSHEELVCRLGGRPKLKEIKWPCTTTSTEEEDDWESIQKEITSLLQDAWCHNPKERPSMARITQRVEETLERHGDHFSLMEEESFSWTRQVQHQQHFFANDPEAVMFLKRKISTSEQTSTSELTVATDPMASDSEVDEEHPKTRWSQSSSRSSVGSSSMGTLPRTTYL